MIKTERNTVQIETPQTHIIKRGQIKLPELELPGAKKVKLVGQEYFEGDMVQYPKRGPTNLWPSEIVGVSV